MSKEDSWRRLYEWIADRVLDMGILDMLMFSINPGYDYRKGDYGIGNVEERMNLYRRCEKEGVGISVMKAFSGGQLLDARTSPFGQALTEYQCLQYALDKPRGTRKKKAAVFLLPGILVFMLTACASGAGTGQTASEPQETGAETVTEQQPETGPAEEAVSQSEILEGAEEDATGAETDSQTETVSSAVYMTTDISPEGLMAVYEALNRETEGNVAVKISTGEPGGHNFLDAEMIRELVLLVDGTFVECNTAYGGSRASTAAHRQAAEDHGFTAYTEVDIMDADGEIRLPITGGIHLTEDIVGANLQNYDFMVVLSHFKGHSMGGFGGAIKNISIGCASSDGKLLIHGAGSPGWGASQDDFLESMAEAASAVTDYFGENILYISVMNNLSVDCDCDSNPAEPDMHDIGILASLDPVALDQACVDLVYEADDGDSLIERMESRNGIHTLEHAEKIGLGSREYELVPID